MKAKRVSRKSSGKPFVSLKTSRAVLSFFIVLLAFSVLLLFVNYKENIISNNMLNPFMALTIIGMGLLVGLLFLINPTKK
jgi:hypothetical protein